MTSKLKFTQFSELLDEIKCDPDMQHRIDELENLQCHLSQQEKFKTVVQRSIDKLEDAITVTYSDIDTSLPPDERVRKLRNIVPEVRTMMLGTIDELKILL